MPFVFEIWEGGWQLHKEMNDEMTPPLLVLQVQPRVVPVVAHSLHELVYEPPGLPQQVSTPLAFEIVAVFGQAHRSRDDGAVVEPEPVLQLHVSVPAVTTQLVHEPV
jgi:hypothetical protein